METVEREHTLAPERRNRASDWEARSPYLAASLVGSVCTSGNSENHRGTQAPGLKLVGPFLSEGDAEFDKQARALADRYGLGLPTARATLTMLRGDCL